MADKKTYREEVAEMFVNSLEENPVEFIKGWDFAGTGVPINAATNKPYNGINKLYLKIIEMEKHYNDPRWMTFKQIVDAGYRLQKDSKGVKVEYWMPYNNKEKRWALWADFKGHENDVYIENINDKEYKKPLFSLRSKIYTVFNATLINGIEPYDIQPLYHNIDESQLIKDISSALGVKFMEEKNSNEAYYIPSKDTVCIPAREQFRSNQAYNRTALHELAHSTGHESRLNRPQKSLFGTPEYAYEELIAEITSAFMGEFINEPLSDEVLNNHKAYVQSWCTAIKNNKEYLFKAIKEAETASDYMIEMADLEKYRQLDVTISKENPAAYKEAAKKEALAKRQPKSAMAQNQVLKQ